MSSILECHCGTFYTQSIVFSYFGSVFDDFEINFVKEVWFFSSFLSLNLFVI